MTSPTWNNRRTLIDAYGKYVVEADAIAEVTRLNNLLAKSQEDVKLAMDLAEQAHRELDASKLRMETLRALTSVSLNKDAPADDRHGLTKERAEAEAQAWVNNYQKLEERLNVTTKDSELLHFLLEMFSSPQPNLHWLHIMLTGTDPREALERARDQLLTTRGTGLILAQPSPESTPEASAP